MTDAMFNDIRLLLQSVDLTQMARDGKMDPVIGREEEIRRTIQSELSSTSPSSLVDAQS